jgi:diguanylate cyclase (GGDEF)-like protein
MIRGWGRIAAAHRLVCALVVLALSFAIAQADTALRIGPNDTVVDLSIHGATLDADARTISVEVPTLDPNRKLILDLNALGPGPRFGWTVHSIENGATTAREFVLVIAQQRFSGSRILPIKPFGPRAGQVVWTGKQQQSVSGVSELSLRLEPGEAVAIALEGSAPMAGVSILAREAHDKGKTSFAFLHGAALAIAFVSALFVLGLYAVRSDRVFIIGTLLGLGFLGFLALESGYLDGLVSSIKIPRFDLQVLRAAIESLLAVSLWFAVWGLTIPNRRRVNAAWALVPIAVIGIALIVWSVTNPAQAATTARLLCFTAVIVGFVITLMAERRANGTLTHGMLLWSVILGWTCLAVYAAIAGGAAAPVFHAALVAGGAVIAALAAFALARYAFAKIVMGRPYLADATARSLALAGARHMTLDWHPAENRLQVDADIATTLGHDRAFFEGPAAMKRFLGLVHESDQNTIKDLLDIQSRNVGDYIYGDVRLMAADGSHLWYQLRASVLAGASRWPERAIGTLTDITELKASEERLVSETVHDPVTGLPSRALFVDRLERELEKPLGLTLRVIHIGLSRFKVFNDGLGHDLGDQLLHLAGQRITELIMPDETLTRVSGTSFAVMFVEAIDRRSATELAQSIVKRISEPASLGGQDIVMSACVGISSPSSDAHNAADLQQQATNALHEATQRGAGACVTFKGEMRGESASKLSLETDLRRAISAKEIEVYYQPIIHLSSRTIVGFEALARWHHPRRGTLQPTEFIAIAEQGGLINEIGLLVLQEAARQLGVWQRTLARDRQVFVSVNVSASQLTDADLLDKLGSLVQREGLYPLSLKIEITESVAMRYPERARQFVSKLKSMGVSVACDDFGTGFSNLASLRDLQFDTLKMDRSFIAQDGIEGRGGVILGSVVSLAHQLGMQVVAEGIEDEQQALLLEAIGVDLGQGYWLGVPMPAREVPGIIAVLPVVQPLPALPGQDETVKDDVPQDEDVEDAFAPPLPGLARPAPRRMEPDLSEDVDEPQEPLLWPLVKKAYERPKPRPAARAKPKPKPAKTRKTAKPKRKSR